MRIRWFGHSSFGIYAKNGSIIITDPYKPGAFAGGIAYNPIDINEPDIVTISHDHEDHNYTDDFSGEFIEVRGDIVEKEITFTGIKTFHDQNRGADQGENMVICFKVDDINLCHLGDLGHNLSDQQIAQLGQVDILFIPVGGYFTIDGNIATDIIERLRPKISIPMHFKTAKCGFPIAEVEEFTKGKTNVNFVKTDEIELSHDKLPGLPEIIVLKHRL